MAITPTNSRINDLTDRLNSCLATLPSINAHYTSGDVHAYKVTEEGKLEPLCSNIYINWLCYTVTWIMNKLHIRTNEQVAFSIATTTLEKITKILEELPRPPLGRPEVSQTLKVFASPVCESYQLWGAANASSTPAQDKAALLFHKILDLSQPLPRDPNAPLEPTQISERSPAPRKHGKRAPNTPVPLQTGRVARSLSLELSPRSLSLEPIPQQQT